MWRSLASAAGAPIGGVWLARPTGHDWRRAEPHVARSGTSPFPHRVHCVPIAGKLGPTSSDFRASSFSVAIIPHRVAMDSPEYLTSRPARQLPLAKRMSLPVPSEPTGRAPAYAELSGLAPRSGRLNQKVLPTSRVERTPT